jgi:hypothetical protein
VLSAVLTFTSSAALFTALLAPTRQGVNNVTSGWWFGLTQDLNFSIVDQYGASSGNFTLRVLEQPPRSSSNWSLVVTAPCGFSSSLSSAAAVNGTTLLLPAACAGLTASVSLKLDGGATVVPPSLKPSVALGSRGTTSSYSFIVTSEDFLSFSQFSLSLTLNQLNDSSWSMQLSGAGIIPFTLSSANAPAIKVVWVAFTVPVPIALDSSTLTYW